jgi:hypothetical protein
MPPRNGTSSNDNIPAGEVVKPLVTERQPLPAQLAGRFDLTAWANSLVNGAKYVDPDPNYLSRLLIMQILTAESLEEVFEQDGVTGLQKAIPNTPDAGTGPVVITDLYVTGSDLNEGVPCYVILTLTSIETGQVKKYTTGAQFLQAQILAALSWGVWPISCEIKRTDKKDRSGKYLFAMLPIE